MVECCSSEKKTKNSCWGFRESRVLVKKKDGAIGCCKMSYWGLVWVKRKKNQMWCRGVEQKLKLKEGMKGILRKERLGMRVLGGARCTPVGGSCGSFEKIN